MNFFKKKKKQNETQSNTNNESWIKEIKRNKVDSNGATQQTLVFTDESKNALTKREKPTSGTKEGLSVKTEKISPMQIKILQNCEAENTASELMKISGRTNKTKFKNDILNPLIDYGFFERTIPDKPKSPNQKYRLTGKFVRPKMDLS